MCKDPIAEEGGFNLYANVGNGPVNRVDHLGLEACECKNGAKKEEDDYGDKCCPDMMERDNDGKWNCLVARVKKRGVKQLLSTGGVSANRGGRDCDDLVDAWVNSAQKAKEAGMLGKMLMTLSFAGGMNARKGIAENATGKPDPALLPTSGFRGDLVMGRQNGGVYQHLWGAVALTMMGSMGNVAMLSQLREDQEDARGGTDAEPHRVFEGMAEVAGDIAGINSGRMINDFLAGKTTAAELDANLRRELCE
jgi:hypothetical protein